MGNLAAVITPCFWTVFSLKPAWLESQLADHDYFIAASFLFTLASDLCTGLLPTLEERKVYGEEQKRTVRALVVGLSYTAAPLGSAILGFTTYFRLVTLDGYGNFPFFWQ